MATIANDGSEIISSTISVSPATHDARLSFAEAYEIELTISEIIKRDYTVVSP